MPIFDEFLHRMRGAVTIAALMALGVTVPATAQVSEYDAGSKILTIPSVSVGPSVFKNVRLLDVGIYTFALQSADDAQPGPAVASYDATSGIVTMPAVKVGASTYLDVRLRNVGNYVFALEGATELPTATLTAVEEVLRQFAAVFASSTPDSGAARYPAALYDSCFRDNGATRSWLVADYDANVALRRARDEYAVAFTRRNVQVTAVRQRANPDGSSRQEIDVEWESVYRDGSTTRDRTTLIGGSSAGTPGCTTPQNSAALRFYGNQQLVGTAVRARTYRFERYSIATGEPLSPAVRYARRIDFSITDPLGNATYVIVTGPGPSGSVNGATVPFSLKFLSPRLLKNAPELQGKPGNFLNLPDDDGFRYCRVSDTGVPVVERADCAGLGATAREWGWTTSTPNAAGDDGFAAQGWVAGGVYRFDVYADDGWKTVNGHVGKTPVATYYDTLDALPYTFVEMAGNGPNDDKFHRLSFGALSPQQVWANAVSAAPAPLAVEWNRPAALSDNRTMVVWGGWEFHQGPSSANSGGAFYPAYRSLNFTHPGSTSLTNPAWPVTRTVAGQAGKTYTEYMLQYLDRADSALLSAVLFQ